MDRIISIRGGKTGGKPRNGDKDCPTWHGVTEHHNKHRDRYIEAVKACTSTKKVTPDKEAAENALRRVTELRIMRCEERSNASQRRLISDDDMYCSFQEQGKSAKDCCFCEAKTFKDVCYFEGKNLMSQLRTMAPTAYKYFQSNPGYENVIQKALNLKERRIPPKKINGTVKNNVFLGFRLIPANDDNSDGTKFAQIEDDDGTINFLDVEEARGLA